MKKFKMYPVENFWEMIDGLVDATYGIETLLNKGRFPVFEGGRMAAEKFLVDEDDPESFFAAKKTETAKETENDFSDVTINRDRRRAARRKATAKAKRRMRRNEPYTDSLVDHGNYIIRKGNTYSWHPEWRKIDKRQRRHEGKNICFNYEADDVATETEDWLTPDEGWLEDYPEEAERMEDLEAMEKADYLEWLQEQEDEIFRDREDLEAEIFRKDKTETPKKMLLIKHIYDVDGGFGDPVEQENVLFVVPDTQRELAEAYVKKYSKPKVYEKPYGELRHHTLIIEEMEIKIPDINECPWKEPDWDKNVDYEYLEWFQ